MNATITTLLVARDAKEALTKIESMRQLSLCFDGNGQDGLVVHSLLHTVQSTHISRLYGQPSSLLNDEEFGPGD